MADTNNILDLNLDSTDQGPVIVLNPVPQTTSVNNDLGVPQMRSLRSYNSCSDWQRSIRAKQSVNITPELRAKIQRKAQRQKRRGKKVKRAKMYQRANHLAKNAWAQGNLKVLSSSPAEYSTTSAQSRNQMRSIQDVYHRSADIRRYDDDDEEDEMALELALDNLEIAQQQEDIQVNDNALDGILNQLRREPANDEELSAKFGLYEDFFKTVEDSRKATYDFWADCKEEFEDASAHVVRQVERELTGVDKEDNMGIIFSEHRWFVYDMTVKADSNCEKLKEVLHNIEIRLELLNNEDDCPFCLEPLQGLESVTLGCCHKACAECWTHWQELKGRNAFCPLCRNEDFLGDIMQQ